MTHPVLTVGDKVKLSGRVYWRVQAVSDNFAALVQQVPFSSKGTLRYTVLDWRNDIRGPCNLIGWGYGNGSYSEADCAEMLTGFEYNPNTDPVRLAALAAGKSSWPSPFSLEISHRNNISLDIVSVNGRVVPNGANNSCLSHI